MSPVFHQDFKFVDPKDLSTPRNGFAEIYVDYWWAVNADGHVAFFTRTKTPQCNRSRSIVEMLCSDYDWCTGIVPIPVMFLPRNCKDYR